MNAHGTQPAWIAAQVAKARDQDEAAFAKLFDAPPPPERKAGVVVWVAAGVVAVVALAIWIF